MRLQPTHVPGRLNNWADDLSRDRLQRFMNCPADRVRSLCALWMHHGGQNTWLLHHPMLAPNQCARKAVLRVHTGEWLNYTMFPPPIYGDWPAHADGSCLDPGLRSRVPRLTRWAGAAFEQGVLGALRAFQQACCEVVELPGSLMFQALSSMPAGQTQPLVVHAYGDKQLLRCLPRIPDWQSFEAALWGVDTPPAWMTQLWLVSPGLRVSYPQGPIGCYGGVLGSEHEIWQLFPRWVRWTEQLTTKPFLSAVIRSPRVYAPGRTGRLELHCGGLGGGDLHGSAFGVSPDIVVYGPSEAAVDICTSRNGWNVQSSCCAASVSCNDLLLLTLSSDVPAHLMPPRRWWTAAFLLLMGRLLFEQWPVLIGIAGGQLSRSREVGAVRRDAQLVIRGFPQAVSLVPWWLLLLPMLTSRPLCRYCLVELHSRLHSFPVWPGWGGGLCTLPVRKRPNQVASLQQEEFGHLTMRRSSRLVEDSGCWICKAGGHSTPRRTIMGTCFSWKDGSRLCYVARSSLGAGASSGARLNSWNVPFLMPFRLTDNWILFLPLWDGAACDVMRRASLRTIMPHGGRAGEEAAALCITSSLADAACPSSPSSPPLFLHWRCRLRGLRVSAAATVDAPRMLDPTGNTDDSDAAQGA